jgi:hypothetical protein
MPVEGILKFQIKHDATYREVFGNNYSVSDFANFIDTFILPNHSLSKIALFTFFPDIEGNIEDYPYQKKIEELKHINSTDRLCLDKLLNTEDGLVGDHFEFLNEMFKVVESTINNKARFPIIPLNNIWMYSSYHRIIRLKSPSGIEKLIRSKGTRYPIFWETWETTRNGTELEYVLHLNFIASKPNCKREWNEWENYTISKYKMYDSSSSKNNMLFGTNWATPPKVIYYFRGNKIDFPYSRHDGVFIVPIGDRYQPALDGQLWKANKLKLFDKNIATSIKAWDLQLQEVIRGAIKTHESKKSPFPFHVQKELKGFVTSKYRKKDHTTTKGEKHCTDDMIEVWYSCRHKRPIDKYTSNCERRRNGFCKWPEAKRRIRKELSGNDSEFEPDSKSPEKEALSKDLVLEIQKVLCKDNTDCKILQAILNGEGVFKSESGKINYSKTARIIGTYDNDVRRRWCKITKRAQQYPEIIDLLK